MEMYYYWKENGEYWDGEKWDKDFVSTQFFTDEQEAYEKMPQFRGGVAWIQKGYLKDLLKEARNDVCTKV